jgi:hypothetical protein
LKLRVCMIAIGHREMACAEIRRLAINDSAMSA